MIVFEEQRKKEKEEAAKQDLVELAAVQEEIKEDNQEIAQEQAQAIRAKNAENFLIRLQSTEEAKKALTKEEEFYVILRTRGVTLEDVQGLNANAVSLTTELNTNQTSSIISSYSTEIRLERKRDEEPSPKEQEAVRNTKIDLTNIKVSGKEELERVFVIVDENNDRRLDEGEFKALQQRAHILSVSETLKEGAKQLSEAVSPLEMEKGKAEMAVGQ